MKFENTFIEGVYIVTLTPFSDDRGFFTRTFCKNEFSEIGLNKEIVQINHSATTQKGAFRGFHFQYPPFAETKIVRCIRGKILDIAVDIRKNSPTFLQYVAVELSESNFNMLYIPEGFAHGFQVLEEASEIMYFVTEFFNPKFEGGINVNDTALNLQLPLPITQISEKDQKIPFLNPAFQGIAID